jgi:hypothetical protein
MHTEKQWNTSFIGLDPLVEKIELFFQGKKFNVKTQRIHENYEVIAFSSRGKLRLNNVRIFISWDANCLLIRFSGGEQIHSNVLRGLLTGFLGGGRLVRDNLRIKELLQHLERDFWIYVEKVIQLLVS